MKPIESYKSRLNKNSIYSVAPYNFVSLPKRSVSRYGSPEDLPSYNNYKVEKDGKCLLNGYIDYSLVSETPIIVSDGLEKNGARFFKDSEGKYAIPGNTIRGLLRTNMQILSFSNIVGERDKKGEYKSSYIENSRFLYRDIAGGNSLSKRYSSILNVDANRRIGKNLKAGYICKRGEKYFIQPALEIKKDIPYFRVDELRLRKIGGEKIDGVNFLYDKVPQKDEEELKRLNKIAADKKKEKGLRKAAEKEIKKILNNYKREKTYKPYQVGISFELDNKGRITKVGNRGECSYEGYMLSGGFILGKRSHYIVPAEDTNQPEIDLEKKDFMIIRDYEEDLVATKKADRESGKIVIKKGKEFYALPKEGEIKPVFYINTDRLYFGFTPYLRLSYTKGVLDGVCREYKENPGISYADSIFGFTDRVFKNGGREEKISYKSRVSVEDAEAVGEPSVDKESIIDIILAEPKPTSYNLYLEQSSLDKKELNIYEEDFKIRGYKQYWLKKYVECPSGDISEEMKITIYPLKEGTEFKGRIYFTNLYEDELGLLAWALKLNDDCWQNIGLAKPYGFGRVKVKDIKLNIEDLDKKYGTFCFDYYKSAKADDYIDEYKRYISNMLNVKNMEEVTSIKEFFCIKATLIDEKDKNNYRYMVLDEFKLKKILPTILQCKDAYSESNMKKIISKSGSNNKNRKDKGNIKRENMDSRSFGNTLMAEAFNKAKKGK